MTQRRHAVSAKRRQYLHCRSDDIADPSCSHHSPATCCPYHCQHSRTHSAQNNLHTEKCQPSHFSCEIFFSFSFVFQVSVFVSVKALTFYSMNPFSLKSTGDDQPTCSTCGHPLTVRHILLDCVDLQDVRRRHFSVMCLRDLLLLVLSKTSVFIAYYSISFYVFHSF